MSSAQLVANTSEGNVVHDDSSGNWVEGGKPTPAKKPRMTTKRLEELMRERYQSGHADGWKECQRQARKSNPLVEFGAGAFMGAVVTALLIHFI